MGVMHISTLIVIEGSGLFDAAIRRSGEDGHFRTTFRLPRLGGPASVEALSSGPTMLNACSVQELAAQARPTAQHAFSMRNVASCLGRRNQRDGFPKHKAGIAQGLHNQFVRVYCWCLNFCWATGIWMHRSSAGFQMLDIDTLLPEEVRKASVTTCVRWRGQTGQTQTLRIESAEPRAVTQKKGVLSV